MQRIMLPENVLNKKQSNAMAVPRSFVHSWLQQERGYNTREFVRYSAGVDKYGQYAGKDPHSSIPYSCISFNIELFYSFTFLYMV
jgi:hypothetical protein